MRSDVKDVLAWLTESRGRHRLSAERRIDAATGEHLQRRLRFSNVTRPGPRYFDHASRTGGGGLTGSAIVPLAYFASSLANTGSGRGDAVEVLRVGAPTAARRAPASIARSLEPQNRRRVLDGDVDERTDEIIGVQANWNDGGLAVRDDGPGQTLFRRGEVFGDGDGEHSVLPAREKCVGCPRSGPPGSIRLFGPIGTSSG